MATTPTTSATSGGPNWTDIINAALALYSKNQGSGSTPNFYQVPETPQETWKNDQTKNLYGMASGFTDQYLKGLGNMNPDWQMPNNLTGNPSFMGGIKVPQIDFSKIPSSAGTGTGTVVTPPATGSTVGEGSNGSNVPGDPFGGIGAPGGSPADKLGNLPSSLLPPGTTPDQAGSYGQIWNWMQQHPNIAKGGADAIAAAIGVMGGPIAGVLAMIGDKAFRMFVDKAAPVLPQLNYHDPNPWDGTAGKAPPAGGPNGGINPGTSGGGSGGGKSNIYDPWYGGFMGAGRAGGGGLTGPLPGDSPWRAGHYE